MSNTGFLWFPFLYLQFWRTFIRGLLTAIMSGEWNSVVGMDHMSPAHSQESDLRNNLPNLDISKKYFEDTFGKRLLLASLLVSSTQSGKWFEEQSAKSRHQQNIILKILLENVFCKQVFMSPAQSPESYFRKKISFSKSKY